MTASDGALPRPPAAAERYRGLSVTVPGGSLYAGVWDPAAGAEPAGTLLAIHGLTANHLAWQWLAVAMPGWRVIAPDLRGRGRSIELPPRYGLAAHADDLAALLSAAAADEAVPVLGHSMGGFIALVLADRHPDRIRRLVLIDGGLAVELPPGVAPGDALTTVLKPTEQRLHRRFASLADVDTFWRQHPGLGAQWGPELAAYSAYDVIGQEPHLRPATRYEAMADDSRDIQLGHALPRANARLRHPALFLRSERGLLDQPPPLFTAEWAARCAEELPGLTIRDIPDTNHFTIIMSHPGSTLIAETLA